MKRICVYAGAALGNRPAYRLAAEQLGAEIARRGLGLVYGGASVGLMGVCANAALDAGGEVIGVLPRSLEGREIGHTRLSDLRIVETLHERKAMMTDLSDGFVALPGGIGTLDELFETATWNYLGVHSKPYGLIDIDGYWAPLVSMLDRMTSEGFLRADVRARFVVRGSPPALLDAVTAASARA